MQPTGTMQWFTDSEVQEHSLRRAVVHRSGQSFKKSA